MKELSLKMKVMTILIPLQVGFVAMGLFAINVYYSEFRDYQGMRESTKLYADLNSFIKNVQVERGKSLLFLNGGATEEELQKQRSEVDQRLDLLQASLVGIPLSGDHLKVIQSAFKRISEARKVVNGKAERALVMKEYAEIVELMFLSQQWVAGVYKGDEAVRGTLDVIGLIEVASEHAGQYRAKSSGILVSKKPLGREERDEFNNTEGKISSFANAAQLRLRSQDQTQAYEAIDRIFKGEVWRKILEVKEEINSKAEAGGYTMDSKTAFDAGTKLIAEFEEVEKARIDAVQALIEEGVKKSSRALVVVTCALLALTMLAFVLAFATVKRLVSKLTSVSSRLSVGAQEVGVATTQVAAAGSELSSAVTEQAAALQETVASIDEVTAMVGKNADNADRAMKVAVQGKDSAVRGQKAVTEMITAIEDISNSNDMITKQIEASNQQLTEIVQVISEIGNKTKIINDIVFQTKLLSFNASVEAARAGEHGKGFAVVAEEVGNLAQMSGNAAKEIGTMLESSIQKVENIVADTKNRVERLVQAGKEKVETGKSVARRCGDELDNLVKNVADVSQSASEIAVASREQSQGVAEISRALAELDQVTQQNTLAAQSTASAAEQLAAQTDAVRTSISDLSLVISGGHAAAQVKESMVKKKATRVKADASAAPRLVHSASEAKPAGSNGQHKKTKLVAGSDVIPSADDSRFEEI